MKQLSVIAFIALAAAALLTAVLRSHSVSANRTDMILSQQIPSAIDASKLPIEEYEDMSLVYSNKVRR